MTIHSITENTESFLVPVLAKARKFSFPERLGQRMANTPYSNSHWWDIMSRLYLSLSPGDQLTAQAEKVACRAAKRGELEALVA